jgi:hypothetical protein
MVKTKHITKANEQINDRTQQKQCMLPKQTNESMTEYNKLPKHKTYQTMYVMSTLPKHSTKKFYYLTMKQQCILITKAHPLYLYNDNPL